MPLPVVTLHNPGSFTEADRLATVPQVSRSVPAFTLKLLFTSVTWLVLLQPFCTTVHWNTLFPPLRPVTVLVRRVGTVTTEEPPLTVHVPVPWPGWAAPSTLLLLQTVPPPPASDDTSSSRTTVVLLALQLPRLTVHLNRFSPRLRPATPLVALLGVPTVELPDSTLQRPVPWTGFAPFNAEVLLQLETVAPASDDTLLFCTRRSALCVQLLFFTVHVNVLPPWPKPVTELVAEDGCWIAAELRLLQRPEPTTGTVALSWAPVLHTSMLEDTWAAEGLSFVTLTRLLDVQPSFDTVHWKVVLPSCRLPTALPALLGVLTTPKPEPRLHVPVSPAFSTAPKVAVVPHTLWSLPAFVTKLLLYTVTLLLLLHVPRLTVHVNVFAPLPKPVTPLWRLPADVMPADPSVDHAPVPCTVCTAPKLADAPQTVWSAPADDCTELLVTTTSEVLVHAPWLTVQRKLFCPRASPPTLLTAAPADVMVAPVPFRTLQTPAPTVGTVAWRVPMPVQLVPPRPAFATTLLFVT